MSWAKETGSPEVILPLMQLKGPHRGLFPLVLADLPLAKQSAGPSLWKCLVAPC